MATLSDYKGLDVVEGATGAGGQALTNNFKNLVDWSPKSTWSQNTDPGANDDTAAGYEVGSHWLRTDVSPPRLFFCQDASTGAAVWTKVALSIASNSQFTAFSNRLGIGTDSPQSCLDVQGGVVAAGRSTIATFNSTDATAGGVIECGSASHSLAMRFSVTNVRKWTLACDDNRLLFINALGGVHTMLLNSLTNSVTFASGVGVNGTLRLGQYTVATLPTAGIVGRTAFATNGRKQGESSGNGTGVPVYDDGTAWRTYSTDATVQA